MNFGGGWSAQMMMSPMGSDENEKVIQMEFKSVTEMCEASALLDANHIRYVYLSPKVVKVYDKRDLEEVKSLLEPYGVPVVEYTPWDGELSQEEIDRLTVKKSK